jgi:hypothetical protein
MHTGYPTAPDPHPACFGGGGDGIYDYVQAQYLYSAYVPAHLQYSSASPWFDSDGGNSYVVTDPLFFPYQHQSYMHAGLCS